MPKHKQIGFRDQKRVVAIAVSATPVINTDTLDQAVITGLDRAITSMSTGLSGTPNPGDTFWVSITDDGTARGIAWGAKFESGAIVTLPNITIAGVRLDVGFVWNTTTNKWRCVAVA